MINSEVEFYNLVGDWANMDPLIFMVYFEHLNVQIRKLKSLTIIWMITIVDKNAENIIDRKLFRLRNK